jgi:hypothetical protein
MWNEVKTLWIGFEPGIEGIAVIVNQGLSTEHRLALGPYLALDGGCSLTRHGAMVISQGVVPAVPGPPREKRYDA